MGNLGQILIGSRHGSEGACRIHKLEVASSNHGGGTIFQKKIVEICEDGELNIEFSQEREREHVSEMWVEVEISFISCNFRIYNLNLWNLRLLAVKSIAYTCDWNI